MQSESIRENENQGKGNTFIETLEALYEVHLHPPVIKNIGCRKYNYEEHHPHQCDKLSLKLKNLCIS
jgi:hypothetical protein